MNLPNRKNADRMLIASFCVAIAVPAIWGMGFSAPAVPAHENRMPAPPPRIKLALKTVLELPGEFEAYFSDRIGFRGDLLEVQATAERDWFGRSPSPRVIVGPRGWLFYSDGTPFDRPVHLRPPVEEHIRNWHAELKRRQVWLAERGIAYYVVIAPDKQSIYPEELPGGKKYLADSPPLDRLVKLAADSGLNLVDVRAPLRAAKEHDDMYLHDDSHWNMAGAYVASVPVREKLGEKFPTAILRPRADYVAGADRQFGDLRSMLGGSKGVPERRTILLPPDFGNVRQNPVDLAAEKSLHLGHLKAVRYSADCPDRPRAVFLHDSFGEALHSLWCADFRELICVPTLYLPQQFIAAEKPDFVVQEIVERQLKQSVPGR